jgi:uncharacterized protein YgfB (UPF0149 family)
MDHPETDIGELDRLLRSTGAAAEAAEAHGAFCGRACLIGAAAIRVWQRELLAAAEPGNAVAHECGQALERLAVASLLQLEAGDLGFRLLLPADDETLQWRALALADWCHGFMHGLVAAGGSDSGPQADVLDSSIASEILDDFSEITRAGAPDEGEESEQAFAELVEYVRVSVQLMYDETAALRQQTGESRQEH